MMEHYDLHNPISGSILLLGLGFFPGWLCDDDECLMYIVTE